MGPGYRRGAQSDGQTVYSTKLEKPDKTRRRPVSARRYASAVDVMGVIFLNVRMDDLRVRTWFCTVENLTVPVLLDTSSIDRFVKGILPPERNFALSTRSM